MSVEFSLVIPCHNEEGILEDSLEKVLAVIPALADSYEILLVNSCSSDGTWDLIQRLDNACGFVRGLDGGERRKGGALSLGLSEARGDVAGFIDADLEIPPEFLKDLMTGVKEGADISIGSKCVGNNNVRHRTMARRISTKVFNGLVQCMLNSSLCDHQAGMKMFRRKVLQEIIPQMTSDGWIWDTEFLVRAQTAGYRITEVPIEVHHTRPSKVNIPLDSYHMFKDVLQLRRRGIRVPTR